MARARYWTEAEDNTVISMWESHSREQISQELHGRSEDAISERARHLGLKSKCPRTIVFSDEQLADLRQLYEDGLTYVDIARHFDVSLFTIYKWLNHLRLPGDRAHGPQRGSTKSRVAKENLAPLEIAPDNFAVDAFSYRAITGREPRDDRRISEEACEPARLCAEEGE